MVHGALSVSALKVMVPWVVRRTALYGLAAFLASNTGMPLKLSAGTAGEYTHPLPAVAAAVGSAAAAAVVDRASGRVDRAVSSAQDLRFIFIWQPSQWS